MTPNKLLLAAATAIILSASTARATTVRAVSFDDKVSTAEAILLGRCTATKTMWDPQHRWIVTYATFQVDQSIKGAPVRELTVVTPGGTVDGVHQSSVGITPFEKGDERVLFVKNTRLGPTVLYFDQGTYTVSKDDRGERIIAPVSAEAVRMESQTGKVVPVERPRPLRDFVGAVHEAEIRKDAAAMMARQPARQTPAPTNNTSVLGGYWFLIVIALAGAALATWQIFKK